MARSEESKKIITLSQKIAGRHSEESKKITKS